MYVKKAGWFYKLSTAAFKLTLNEWSTSDIGKKKKCNQLISRPLNLQVRNSRLYVRGKRAGQFYKLSTSFKVTLNEWFTSDIGKKKMYLVNFTSFKSTSEKFKVVREKKSWLVL